MSFTYDPERTDFPTTVEKIRALVTDTDIDDYVFENQELEAFYSLGGDIYEAASLAWGEIAGNQDYMDKLFQIREEETIDIERAADIAHLREERLHQKSLRTAEATETEWDDWDQEEVLDGMVE